MALVNQIRWMDPARWRWLAVLGEDGPLVPRLRSHSVDVTVLPLPEQLGSIRQHAIRANSFANPLRLGAAWYYVFRLVQHLSRSRVDLIHINSMRMAPLGIAAGKILRLPIVWQAHSVAASPAMSPAGVRMTQFLAKHVDHLICPSTSIAATLPKVRSTRMHVIPNGIDPNPYHALGPTMHRRVAMVARLAPIKGQHIFLEAIDRIIARHSDVEFVLAGTPLFSEGDYANRLHRQAASLSPESVRFAGHVDDVPGFLNQTEVFVHASITAEGLPLGVIEAMMAGKAIIATAAGGPVEMIEDGVSGRLIPPGDARALAEALDDLLDDREGARAMGRRAREVALARYDIRKTAPQFDRVYEAALARGEAPLAREVAAS